jgi:S1-C subfamily serine protease
MIETVSGGGDGSAGARVIEVVPGGVAEATGIEAGDVIIEAAGVPIAGTGDLIATVKRQAPGTWLPLKIQRDGATLDRVARFPPRPSAP